MSITREKQRILLNGCNSLEQKVFDQVPIQDPWTAEQIHRHLLVGGKSQSDYKRVRGALGGLKDRGLIKEVSRHSFLRVPLKVRELREPAEEEELKNPRLGDLTAWKVLKEKLDNPDPEPEIPEINLDRSGPPKVVAPVVTTAVKTEPVSAVKETEMSAKSDNTLELLSGVATELMDLGTDLATRLKTIASKVEDLALALEEEKKADEKLMKKFREWKALMKTLSDDD